MYFYRTCDMENALPITFYTLNLVIWPYLSKQLSNQNNHVITEEHGGSAFMERVTRTVK